MTPAQRQLRVRRLQRLVGGPGRRTCHHIDALSYEGNLLAANGPCGPTPLKEGIANLFAEDNATSVGSLILYPNGSDTDEAATDWVFTTSITPGAANVP